MNDLQKELNEMNAKRRQAILENTAGGDFPKIKREYTYRKATIIRVRDLAL